MMTGTVEDGKSDEAKGVQGPAQPTAEPPQTPEKTFQLVPWTKGMVKSHDYRTCPKRDSYEDGVGVTVGNQPEHGEVRVKRWNSQVALAWFFSDGGHVGIVWTEADFEALMRGEDPMAKEGK